MEPDGGEWVLMLWAAWGKDKTVNYLKALSKNNIVLAQDRRRALKCSRPVHSRLTCA